MKPDKHGCLRVFVGGKYSEWTAVEGDDDRIILIPAGPNPLDRNPNQLTFADDGEIDLKDLGR